MTPRQLFAPLALVLAFAHPAWSEGTDGCADLIVARPD